MLKCGGDDQLQTFLHEVDFFQIHFKFGHPVGIFLSESNRQNNDLWIIFNNFQ